MPKYQIILENTAGKLDERIVEADDAELCEHMIDFVTDIGSFRDGDVIRVVEKS